MRTHHSRGAATLLALFLAGCPEGLQPPPPQPQPSFYDPLSMPQTPSLSVDSFRSASNCQSCHPQHYAQWTTSRHAYAMKDHVFRALVRLRQQAFDGAQDQFCTQCHSAPCARGGECVDGFAFEDLSPLSLEGVTCEACHKVSGLERTHNSGHVLDPAGPIRGPIMDPAPNPFHATEPSPLHKKSDFCGGCHDVIEVSGLHLERPFAEWSNSPAANTEATCQSCHMPASPGQAAVDGPMRTVHEHRFIGVDLPSPEVADEAERALHRSRVQALLSSTATLTVSASPRVQAGAQVDLHVTVTNTNHAHDFPTGTTFIRQVWIAVTVQDAQGQVLYETGGLDANGDLRDAFSALDPYGDHDLLSLSSNLIDARGNPTILPWQATEHVSRSLNPLHARTHTLFVPTSSTTPGPLSVQATLRFRPFAPYLYRVLELADEPMVIYDVAEAHTQVQVDLP